MRNNKIGNHLKSALVASSMTLLLAGCLGGGSSSTPAAPAASTLGGVAAVGFPITSGNVSVNCANGAPLSTTTDPANGSWQVTLSGQTLPCGVRVSGGSINGAPNTTPYHSIATAPGTVNITPLTDLMVANLVGADPATWFAGLTPAQLAAITQANVDTALANLRTALATFTPLAATNPVTAMFSPVPGNPVDDMLAAMQAALTTAGVPYANLLASFQINNAPVATPGGFNAALAANYTPPAVFAVTSVAPASGAVGGTVTITGSGFDPFPLHNQVNFNGVAATVVSATATQLVVTVPAGATTGPITVRNIMANGGATLTAQGNFTVTAGGGGGGGGGGVTPVTGLMGGAILGTPLALTDTVTTFARTTPGAGTTLIYGDQITTDGSNIYVVDAANFSIRKTVIATGVETTVAGPDYLTCVPGGTCPALAGSVDGVGSAAKFAFTYASGITTDGTNLYVADTLNKTIRQIVIATGQVTTLAGSPGLSGYADGIGAAARFFEPAGITTDGVNLYVADRMNGNIRKIVIATGQVTTLAGPDPVACAPFGCPFGAVDGVGATARFRALGQIATDGTNLYLADAGNHTIRKIVIATGAVSTIAGTAAALGYVDGIGAAARFNQPHGITTDGTFLYVTEFMNKTVRKIDLASGIVTTIAGAPPVGFGIPETNGIGAAATFPVIGGIATDGTKLYVQSMNLRIIQ